MTAKSGGRPSPNDRTLLGVSPGPSRVIGSMTQTGGGAAPGASPALRTAGNDRTLLGVARVSRPIPASVTSVASLEPGAIVSDRYVLGEPLNEGGMATIWAATDRATGRAVIVKSIHLHMSENEEVIRRFQQEADIISAVRSPHVVELLDRGVLAGSPYLVLERLEGEDLEERLAGRRLTVDECVKLLEEVALALAPAHAAGVVHRDLKPANIFLARTGDGEIAKLLDFGIAKLRESTLALTAAGQTVGTPEYMSPEQLQGTSDLDGRSDLFAMAAVLYTCLTGDAPFAGEGIAHTFERIMTADLVPPSRAARDVPKRIDAFFARALASDRDARYPDAAAMAAAFREAAADDAPDLEVRAASAVPPETVGSQGPAAPHETRRGTSADPIPSPRPGAAPPVASTSSAAAPTAMKAVPGQVSSARPGGPSPMPWILVAVLAVGILVAVALAMGSSDDAASRSRGRSRTDQITAPERPAPVPPAAPSPTGARPAGR